MRQEANTLFQRSLLVVNEGQIRELHRMIGAGKSLSLAARMTDMDRKTARKYRDQNQSQTSSKATRDYRTRVDPFEEVWPSVEYKLRAEPSLKAYALFEWIQQNNEGVFPDSTRRTFERRVARWKTLHGPSKSVVIEQVHRPGQLAASDFTVCNSLGVTIAKTKFDHTLFHCVLTYSNYESITLCHSESFEALSTGIQNAMFQFGGVPKLHRTDSLAAAVRNHSSKKQLTQRYEALMDHYGCEAQHTNARCPNENGDVESLNGKIKNRIEQALLIRGSRDFQSKEQYEEFLSHVVEQANRNRQVKFNEDQAALSALPARRLDTDDFLPSLRVSKHSTICVRKQVYSVPSRLIGTSVDVRITIDSIEVSVADTIIETMPRLIGKGTAAINYRHIIDSLVRKPGSFENYRYHEQMFPRTIFRVAYDCLDAKHAPRVRDRTYLQILQLAAKESEQAVASSLTELIDRDQPITTADVLRLVARASELPSPTDVDVPEVDLAALDELISSSDVIDSDPTTTNDKECHDGTSEEEGDPKNGSSEEVCSEQSGETHIDTARSVSGATPAELSGSLRDVGREGGSGGTLACGVSCRVDAVGNRSTSGGASATLDDPLKIAARENLDELRLHSPSAECDSQAGNLAGGPLLGCTGERASVRQTGQREEPRTVCARRAIDSPRTQCAVHDLQPVGATVVAGEIGTSPAPIPEDTVELRGLDHRRSRVCATEPRGDGSSVHVTGGTLRTGQRVADEQFGIQQVGSDFQGCDDHSGGDRSIGSSQRDHRAERGQLPSRSSQGEENWSVGGQVTATYEIFSGEF